MSWGDPQTALSLNTDQNTELSSLLLTVAGPSRILLHDSKWQALLHHYNVLVHLDEHRNALVQTATKSMAKHATTSGNLAALTLHCARMLRDLSRAVVVNRSDGDLGVFPMQLDLTRSRSGSESLVSVGSASVTSNASRKNRKNSGKNKSSFVLIGKARASCGALSLLKIFLHRTILSGGEGDSLVSAHNLESSFTYKEQKRGVTKCRDAVKELLASLVQFISIQGNPSPEVYDTIVLSISLLLVMLSPQLYQPMLSSTQREETGNFTNDSYGKPYGFNSFFLDKLFQQDHSRESYDPYSSKYNMPEKWEISLLNTIFRWYINRPEPPKRSITAHHIELLKSLIHSRGETPGPDGLYENHRIVAAEAPQGLIERSLLKEQECKDKYVDDDDLEASVILTAKRGVLSISSSLLLIPWRLVRLAFTTIGSIGVKGYELLGGGEHWRDQFLQDSSKEVLWISESPLADLGSCVFLLFCHNHRFDDSSRENHFRSALVALEDNRWTGPETIRRGTSSFDEDHSIRLEHNERQGLLGTDSFDPELGGSVNMNQIHLDENFELSTVSLSVNFESLFQALGFTVHTELGTLFLYTMMQSNSNFASALAVRSDLDTVILPMLRTLYFSSAIDSKGSLSRPNAPEQNNTMKETSKTISQPFRSPLSLYLVMINLLLFSQDISFGPDAFRRLMIENVPWYKERHLRDISLGSVIILCLLRSMTFNLSRLRDGFLLSNTLAVLMNLTPHATNIHSYTSLRLVSVTLNCMRRYASLNVDGEVLDEEDIMSEQGMYGETCRALLQLLNKCISPTMIEKNLHILYALVYRKAELDLILSKSGKVFWNDLGRISALVSHAHSLLANDDDALTADKAMNLLKNSILVLQQIDPNSNGDNDNDFTYLYEEEDDPEIFFIPYIWDVVSSVVTPGFIEWDKSCINIISTETEVENDSVEFTSNSVSSDSISTCDAV